MLGVYVHFPYCRALCPYCNFNSYAAPEIPHAAYADAVIAEVRARAAAHALEGRPLVSVYFGGGTPGLWEPTALRRVLDAIGTTFTLDPRAAEITVEVNPGSVDAAALPRLRDAGANRLSIGVQSLRDDALRRLGRLHSSTEALATLERGRAAGFEEVSLDFMFGLPQQDITEWRHDLETIVSLSVPHLSTYQLTVEDGTPLSDWVRRGQVVMPSNEDEAAFFDVTRAVLRAAGYEHYEVSNFARPRHRAVHNSIYWLGGEWLGVGAGAHGFLRTSSDFAGAPPGAAGVRWADEDDPPRYMARSLAGELPEAWREWPDPSTLVLEELMTGLRWLDGLDLGAFTTRTGVDLRVRFSRVIAGLATDGLAYVAGERLRLTEAGLLLLNTVVRRFFEASDAAPPGAPPDVRAIGNAAAP
jgi:oxygen-independent coproporphyrinogen-3 oxidase